MEVQIEANTSRSQASKTSTDLSRYYPKGLFSPDQLSSGNGNGVFGSSKDEDKKLRDVELQVIKLGIADLGEDQMRYALRSNFADGDTDKAVELLTILEDAATGILRDYTPSIKLLGAENRNYVTCYLDALLFAMFARLDCFEAILFNTFSDDPRRKLALILRLWVNMLRSGVLITTDITKQLQESLAECGWADAAELRQQDASEAFTFITEKLELPLLTLKMDIYHTGKEDLSGDHKFINERLLELAIPSETEDGKGITLEDCLETYFNNRIEVKRHLNRRTTLNSMSSIDSTSKGFASHVETVELSSSQLSTPTGGAFSPTFPDSVPPLPTLTETAPSPIPGVLRRRTTSIVQERFVPERDDSNKENNPGSKGRPEVRGRKGSIRKEVMMPAWQMFSLIPWYTDNTPTNDAQVAAHFSSKRPILGMCLKRYSMLPNGKAVRLNTYVDIPIEIGLPHFIQDDQMKDEGPLYGNFKLSLQAVVCHRGVSVDSGHYISLVRGTSSNAYPSRHSSFQNKEENPDEANDHWMRFDDLARERITLVDIEQALKDESPYLLFYQILPIGDTDDITAPPSTTSDRPKTAEGPITGPYLASSPPDINDGPTGGVRQVKSSRPSLEITVPNTSRAVDPVTRQSVAYSDSTANGNDSTRLRPVNSSADTTPKDEESRSSFSFSRRASKRGKGNSQTRSENQISDSRKSSTTISRAAAKLSGEKLSEPNYKDTTLDVEGNTVSRSGSRRRSEKNEKTKQLKKRDTSKGKGKERQKNNRSGKPDRECSMM
ncbi:hypothetical protein FQN54_007524 [Arachnomyces sp. PD_36]|nr:hypothetical protein FQN54_007524 [Arachnomyces sp. PD_36]